MQQQMYTCCSEVSAHRTTVSLQPAAVCSNTIKRVSCCARPCQPLGDSASAALTWEAMTAALGSGVPASQAAELATGEFAARRASKRLRSHAACRKYMTPSCSAVIRTCPANRAHD